MGILRQKLFDEAERRDLADTVARMESAAQQAILKQPEYREVITQRLNEKVAAFIRVEVRKKRRLSIVFGGVLFGIGILILWLGSCLESRFMVMLGGSLFISGIGTALINGAVLLVENERR